MGHASMYFRPGGAYEGEVAVYRTVLAAEDNTIAVFANRPDRPYPYGVQGLVSNSVRVGIICYFFIAFARLITSVRCTVDTGLSPDF